MGKASSRKKERKLNLIPDFLKGNEIVKSTDIGKIKISEALLEVIDDYYREDMTIDMVKKLVNIGSLAWNLSYLDETERLESIGFFINDNNMYDEDKTVFLGLIKEFSKKKIELFPDEKRYIIGNEVRKDKNGLKLNISSVFPKENIESVSSNELNTG
jgi:hypothetical protein